MEPLSRFLCEGPGGPRVSYGTRPPLTWAEGRRRTRWSPLGRARPLAVRPSPAAGPHRSPAHSQARRLVIVLPRPVRRWPPVARIRDALGALSYLLRPDQESRVMRISQILKDNGDRAVTIEPDATIA